MMSVRAPESGSLAKQLGLLETMRSRSKCSSG
eukprot:CAMPEP_0115732794 /NCGR_PEP_ID=MMETSP0272-20121206/85312_1 /TAXON_ID=71861 /ORGANISM="Scrippsiella trochoidea, Strain CCMP3099" /LENGTH=31 /DNA_ID= /DNA_START= /DNA_END= /DNA_ORIENTATION=